MANSRSNIYPVQLQGAELNLNKLDAEIKQYSGFNKNNAPFVGGCLSNIFVRTQNVEGATDDNTIIDEEGNIYTVDTEGFYKNGEKVIAYEDAPFIECEKFSVAADIIKAFSDKVFLRLQGDNLYLNDIELGKLNIDIEKFLSLSAGVWYEGKFIFACCVKIGNTGNYMRTRIVTLEEDANGNYVLGNVNYTSTRYPYYNLNYTPYAILISNDTFVIPWFYDPLDQYKPLACFKGSFNSPTVNYYYEQYSSDYWGAFADGWADSYNNKTTLLSRNNNSFIDFYSYPRNMIAYKLIGNAAFVNNNGKSTATAIHIDPVTDINITRQSSDDLITITLRPENVIESSKFSNTNITNVLGTIQSDEYDNSLVRLVTSYQGYDTYTHFYSPLGAVSVYKDEEGNFHHSGGATIGMDRCIFSVLFNNSLISGIAAYNDYNKILVSEWNSVKAGTISYLEKSAGGDISLVYGDYNNNYYILRKSDKPQIKKMYNQIVSNVLYNKNSYDTKRKKVLYFAPGFNCSASSKSVKLDTFSEDANLYYAGAINEYSQEDNSSIILNPYLRIIKRSGAGTDSLEPLRDFMIDIYYGLTEVKYKESIVMFDNRTDYYLSNLKGLLFPSDTNGNVEYSPNLFSEMTQYGTDVLIKSENTAYPLVIGNNNEPIMSFYMASGVENLNAVFIIQGQYYGTIGNQLFSMQFSGGVIQNVSFIVDITGLQFVGNTPYEALFFSKTNRCLFSFTGANVLTQKQFIDKISEVKDYLYNPATQTVFLITDIGVLFYGLFGQFLLEYPDISKIFLLQNGIVMSDNAGDYRYIKYYLDESDTDFVKENIRLETCFYGMNNQTVTINDCLYMRIFSEEHEEGNLEVSATTLSLEGRMTEKTTFKIKASDWDKVTHTIYLRYQPKEQRGLGISFSINSPFKIASLSIGSQADAILIDKVSKGAINAPQRTSNNVEW